MGVSKLYTTNICGQHIGLIKWSSMTPHFDSALVACRYETKVRECRWVLMTDGH